MNNANHDIIDVREVTHDISCLMMTSHRLNNTYPIVAFYAIAKSVENFNEFIIEIGDGYKNSIYDDETKCRNMPEYQN